MKIKMMLLANITEVHTVLSTLHRLLHLVLQLHCGVLCFFAPCHRGRSLQRISCLLWSNG